MKNFKIAMILVAAVAFFCSCGDPEAPTISFVDADGLNEMTFDLTNASADVKITLTTSDSKGITNISVTRTMYDANNNEIGDAVEYGPKAADYEGKTDFSGVITETLAKADVKDAVKIVYEAVVVNKKEVEAKATYTVNVVAPAFTEATFEWKRVGAANATGLDAFGLKWTGNAKTVYAQIKPIDNNTKLYSLAAADYDKAIADINFGAEQTVYAGVQCDRGADYNDVIATVYNGKTYVINVKKSTITSDATTGTTITITGNVKTYESTPAVSAK